MNSTENEIDDIKRLESCFNEIAPINLTVDQKKVKRWHKECFVGELFENLPTEGIVFKVNCGNTKKRLGINSKCPNWAIVMKD